MINLFLPYSLSLLAKEKGYEEPAVFGNVSSLYTNKREHTFYTNYGMMYSGLSDGYISAPLYQQIFDWLESKGLYIFVWCAIGSEPKWWDWRIESIPLDIHSGEEESYPEKHLAYNAAIEKALKFLLLL